MAQLSEAAQHHYTQERLMQHMDAQLEVVRKERDEAEEELKRLSGGEIGKWFQFAGGAFMATGALATRYPSYVIAGWCVLGCGVFVQILGLLIPYIVYRMRKY